MTRRIAIPRNEVVVRFSRASGPGGQNVNKRDTRVEVRFDIAASRALTAAQKARALERLGHRLDPHGMIRVIAAAARTQSENRAAAVHRLEGLLTDAVKPPPPKRRPTRPSKASVDRRIAEKRARGTRKRERSARHEED